MIRFIAQSVPIYNEIKMQLRNSLSQKISPFYVNLSISNA